MRVFLLLLLLLCSIHSQETQYDDRVRLNVTDIKKDTNKMIVNGDSDLVHTSDGIYEYYQLITPIISGASAEDFSFKITPRYMKTTLNEAIGIYVSIVDFAYPINTKLHREIIVYPHPDNQFVITLKITKTMEDK